VAVGLVRELESLGLAVRIKWPNDLLIGDRKLAGLLPRLRRRGSTIALARVGLGLNGWNRVPPGAIGLAEALAARPGNRLGAAGARWLADPLPLAARVLRALDWACARANQAELVRCEAQARLWLPATPITHEGELWQAQGLGLDGSLVVSALVKNNSYPATVNSFDLSWFVSPKPSTGGCSTLSNFNVSTAFYVGSKTVSPMAGFATSLQSLTNIDLNYVQNSNEEVLTAGNYCVWAFVDDFNQGRPQNVEFTCFLGRKWVSLGGSKMRGFSMFGGLGGNC
jgi:hypothetical protein